MISSTGDTAEIMGEVLGQYDYVEEKECYVQKSTEQNSIVGSPDIGVRRYLCSKYYQNIKWWIVFHTPNEETETNIELLNFLGFCPDHGVSWDFGKTQCTFLYIKSRELKTGWEYYDGETWHPDPSLTVTPGTLPPVPSQYTVLASHENWSAYSGVYKKTEHWWAGRPVYVKNEETEQIFPHLNVLYLYQESSWRIGNKLGWYALRESQPGNWTYVSYGPYEFPLSVKMVPGGGGQWLFYLKLGLIIVAIAGLVVIFLSCAVVSYLQSKKKMKKASKWTPPTPYSLTRRWNTGSDQLTPYSIQ